MDGAPPLPTCAGTRSCMYASAACRCKKRAAYCMRVVRATARHRRGATKTTAALSDRVPIAAATASHLRRQRLPRSRPSRRAELRDTTATISGTTALSRRCRCGDRRRCTSPAARPAPSRLASQMLRTPPPQAACRKRRPIGQYGEEFSRREASAIDCTGMCRESERQPGSGHADLRLTCRSSLACSSQPATVSGTYGATPVCRSKQLTRRRRRRARQPAARVIQSGKGLVPTCGLVRLARLLSSAALPRAGLATPRRVRWRSLARALTASPRDRPSFSILAKCLSCLELTPKCSLNPSHPNGSTLVQNDL